jgi:hypothetical protein
MFAILISEENMPEIAQSELLDEQLVYDISLYLNRPRPWYLVRGYVPPRGPLVDWTILPAYSLAQNFDYDPETIKTSWSQLVRKESP